ncbi:PP2C family protein-serine/threonine phosphatase [Georgenia faecalis]|uniref:PP2C family protein-serine/threonine phosphatase n=1 Tax=Georgenia faecalis TaxID=2483799 RepID=A0ABV9D7D6_9MICO|nr:PP2C family protein-serine/threonine phosphatase [Georgenia faecalis]
MTTPDGGPEVAAAAGRTDRHDARMSAALTALIDGTHLATPDELPVVVAEAGRHLGLDVAVYLVTLDQRELVPFTAGADEPTMPVDAPGSAAGRAFREITATEDASGLWLPLLDGVERIGVLRFRAAGPTDFLRADRLRSFDLLVGHLVAVVTPYGDTVSRLRGAMGRTVEAELLWNLVPPLTYATRNLVISGLLEPCEQVAGDVFDYAVDETMARIAIFDGSGHNLDSGLLTSVALATYRNGRRRGDTLVATAAAIDQVLLEHTDGAGYATGILAELDTETGHLRYVNAGHPRPILLREGRFVETLDGPGRPLFGLGDSSITVGEQRLQPGDKVVLYTDGITEARAEDGSFFGLDRLIGILERCSTDGTPASETVRLTVQDVLRHQRDVLQDDATMVLVEWGATSAGRLNPE